VPEGVALSLPILQDAIKRVLFQQHADPDVLLVRAAALEEPAIDLLTYRLALLCHLGTRGAEVIAQVSYQPQLERVNAGQVAAVLKRKPRHIVFSIEIPEIVVADRVARQVAREKRPECGSVGLRPERTENHGKAPRDRPRAVRQQLQSLVG